MKTERLLVLPFLFSFGVLAACSTAATDPSTDSTESEIAYRKLDCHELDSAQCGSDPTCAVDECSGACVKKSEPQEGDDEEVVLLPCAVKVSDACEAQKTEADCLATAAKRGAGKGCGWDSQRVECISVELQ